MDLKTQEVGGGRPGGGIRGRGVGKRKVYRKKQILDERIRTLIFGEREHNGGGDSWFALHCRAPLCRVTYAEETYPNSLPASARRCGPEQADAATEKKQFTVLQGCALTFVLTFNLVAACSRLRQGT